MNYKTVVRKFLYLSERSLLRHEKFLGALEEQVTHVMFDEMESFEVSKCLPLSLPLVVRAHDRKILAFGVASMPAKGLLAAVSLRRYGRRADHRRRVIREVLKTTRGVVSEDCRITSDECPRYPRLVRAHLGEKVEHRQEKGRRGCVVGQGELKRIGFDPLFSLNHTCAMLRASVSRLARRTWCTTKRAEMLHRHIALYADYHNTTLT